MADLSAVQAYQAAVRAAQQSGRGAEETPSAEIDFGSLVANAVQQSQAGLQHAEQMTAAGALGQADLIDVVTAVSAAEMTLETVVTVRDEVVRAYQEILRMPI